MFYLGLVSWNLGKYRIYDIINFIESSRLEKVIYPIMVEPDYQVSPTNDEETQPASNTFAELH